MCQIVRAGVKTSAVGSDVLSVWWGELGLKNGPIFLTQLFNDMSLQ